jgi:hypothetical protein
MLPCTIILPPLRSVRDELHLARDHNPPNRSQLTHLPPIPLAISHIKRGSRADSVPDNCKNIRARGPDPSTARAFLAQLPRSSFGLRFLPPSPPPPGFDPSTRRVGKAWIRFGELRDSVLYSSTLLPTGPEAKLLHTHTHPTRYSHPSPNTSNQQPTNDLSHTRSDTALTAPSTPTRTQTRQKELMWQVRSA